MKHIEPVTLTVTLTGRKAAAYRRMLRCDGTTAQESANEAVHGYVAAFTDMEEERRANARNRRLGIAPKPDPDFSGFVRLDSAHVAKLRAIIAMLTEQIGKPYTLEDYLNETMGTTLESAPHDCFLQESVWEYDWREWGRKKERDAIQEEIRRICGEGETTKEEGAAA